MNFRRGADRAGEGGRAGIWLAAVGAGFCGLLLGLILFYPRVAVWGRILDGVAGRMPPGAGLSWGDIRPSGLTGAEVDGLVLTLAGRRLELPRTRLSFGLFTPLRAEAGPPFNLRLDAGPRGLRLSGHPDLGGLGPLGVRGVLDLDLRVALDGWLSNRVRETSFSLRAGTLSLPGGRELRGLEGEGVFEGRRLVLRSLRLDGPLPLNGSGEIRPDWSEPGASRISLSSGGAVVFSGRLDAMLSKP